MNKSSAIDVAAYVLELVEPVTTMKLQKLVNYAQVCSLVRKNKPIFDNRIEAWVNGPVVPDLFKLHSKMFLIKRKDLSFKCDSSRLSKSEKACIEEAVELHGAKTGEELRRLTHYEKPWKSARIGLSDTDRSNNEITLDSMTEYYCSRFSEKTAINDREIQIF